MKTIKQAAQEYAAQERVTRSEYVAFVAGVEFAQRWISVDEELPEGVDYENSMSEKVLFRDDYNDVHTGVYDHYYGSFFLDENNLQHRVITHWRQIELK